MVDDARPRAAGTAPFARIEPLRAHEYVAEQLRRHIALGLTAAGDALPAERELASMFGVGRATIQAALRLLDAEGLIESRRGRRGGTFVVGPARDEASYQRLLLELRLGRAEIEDALKFRRIVELGACRLACESATEEDIAGLRELCEVMRVADSELEFHRADTEFHVEIARVAKSELVREAVERSRVALNDAIIALPESDVWHERIHEEHERIVSAIAAGDQAAAEAAVEEHLAHTEQAILALLAAVS